ncbi:hypothetical protein [Halocynthiibacter sp.]|uniref:hypothetical protein n=1 Tax=Halocynthiibacter sp. TaxID=1979210 RepID=UPI003C33648F
MKIAYHIGAHSADGDNLLRGLLKDKERLLQSGIAVPGPGKYRRRLREALAYAQDVPMTQAQGQEILEAILEGEQPQRLVMSAPNFMGFPKFAIEKNILYPDAHDRISNLINLLPADESEIHLSISSPVSFVPAVMALNTTKNQNPQVTGADPRRLLWSELIQRLRQSCPNAPLVVWCQEDTPMIWSEVLLTVAGLAASVKPLEASNDILSEIMTQEGLQRYQAYMQARSPMTQQQHSAVAAAFLDKFAVPDALEMEINMPSWNAELIEQAMEVYEEDTARIMSMPDVDMIQP